MSRKQDLPKPAHGSSHTIQKSRHNNSQPYLSAAPRTNIPTSPEHIQPNDVLGLQRSIGNRAVSQMLVQTQLKVGPASDAYEEEARQIADQVVNPPSTSPTRQGGNSAIQRVPTIQRIQRSAPIGAAGASLNDAQENALQNAQGGGRALPDTVRRTLEPKLGADFSNVKIHTDAKAMQLSRDLGAKAFTYKNHIYYGAGQSPNDLKLTAHEAVHTIQQGAVAQRNSTASGASGAQTIQREYLPTGTDDPLNEYAEGDQSLFYGMEAPGDYRNKTLGRRNVAQRRNNYPTIDSVNRDVGINGVMGKSTSATGIFKIRQALSDPDPVGNWRTYFPQAIPNYAAVPQLKNWIETLVSNRHHIGLYDFSDSKKVGIWGFRKRAGKKKLGRKDRLSKNISAGNQRHITSDRIYNWLSIDPTVGVNYNYGNLPNGITQEQFVAVSEWIYRAFFRRTSKLGLSFAINVLKAKVYFNKAGAVGYTGAFGTGTKQQGGLVTASNTENQSQQRAITVSEYRHAQKLMNIGFIPNDKIHFYDEYQ